MLDTDLNDVKCERRNRAPLAVTLRLQLAHALPYTLSVCVRVGRLCTHMRVCNSKHTFLRFCVIVPHLTRGRPREIKCTPRTRTFSRMRIEADCVDFGASTFSLLLWLRELLGIFSTTLHCAGGTFCSKRNGAYTAR